jgi:hypothetical protein
MGGGGEEEGAGGLARQGAAQPPHTLCNRLGATRPAPPRPRAPAPGLRSTYTAGKVPYPLTVEVYGSDNAGKLRPGGPAPGAAAPGPAPWRASACSLLPASRGL